MTHYQPNGDQWQVLAPGPGGVMLPGKLYPTRDELLREHPDAVYEHPEPIPPQDLKTS